MSAAEGSNYPGALPPPPGVTPNLASPESIGWKLVVPSVVFPVFAVLFWLLRFYTTRCIVRRTYTDDWLIIVSQAFAIGLSIIDISQTRYGMGVHQWNVSPADFRHVMIFSIPASVCYNLSTLFVKASILSFYLRFAAANRPFRLAVYFVLFVITGYSLNSTFSFLYLCTPMESLWDNSVQGTCVNIYEAYLVSSALNAVTDIVILLMPIWLLWPLRLCWRQKIAVGLVVMPGGFVCSVSLIRLAVIPAGANDPDTTWVYCVNNIWCLVELYVGIICACLPSLKAFANCHFPGVFDISAGRPSHELPVLGTLTSSPAQMQMWTAAREASDATSKEAIPSLYSKSDPSGAASHATDSEADTTGCETGDASGSDQASMV